MIHKLTDMPARSIHPSVVVKILERSTSKEISLLPSFYYKQVLICICTTMHMTLVEVSLRIICLYPTYCFYMICMCVYGKEGNMKEI